MSMPPPSVSVRRHNVSASASHASPALPKVGGMRASPSDPILLDKAGGPSHSTIPPAPVHKTQGIPASTPSAGVAYTSASSTVVTPSRSRPTHTSYQSQSAIPIPASPAARPVTPGHRVTKSVGCFPVSPSSVESRRQTWESPSAPIRSQPSLPDNPGLWTPSELAQYLSYALRTGGPDGTGPTLPAPVVEDVVSWVLRSRVTGSHFMRGVDQGLARPPPFLPVLASMSRRLRRQQGMRVSDVSDLSVTEDDSSPDAAVTRVRKLAHAFDVISSASEASGDEGPSLSSLREEVAPESVHGFGRATPKTESRRWSRRDSAASAMSSVSAASGLSASSNSRWRQRVNSNSSAISAASGSQAWAFDSPEASTTHLPESPSVALWARTGTRRSSKQEPTASDASGREDMFSPPPPYDSPSAIPSPAQKGLLFPPQQHTEPPTPEADKSTRSGSITPLNGAHEQDAAGDSSPTLASHLHRMSAHQADGVDPYAVLRRGGTRPRLPTTKDDGDTSDDGQPHWTTTRRVTARPTIHDPLSPQPMTPAVKSPTRLSTPGSRRRRREREMERVVASLNGRIRELEERLALVEAPPAQDLTVSTSPIEQVPESPVDPVPTSPTKAIVPHKRRGWLAALGLADNDGTEPRLQDVPAVLFLMGVGVGVGFGAVVVRLVIGRNH